MAKQQLKYLKDADDYLKHVISVWAKYFYSKDVLKIFFEKISAEQEKDLFLRVGSFYRFLVIEGRYQFKSSEWNSGMSYIDDTYKYIAIFSLIEALDSPGAYVDFYHWLQRNKNKIEMNFAKTVIAVLDEAYKQYKSENGATQAAVLFFSRLDQADQEFIQKRIEIRGKQRSLKQLAQLLYDIRSQFVHQAHLVLNFGNKISVGRQRGQIIINNLSIKDLCMLFEHGFLKRFGYQGSTRPHA
jgi:hypothetical protein